MTRKLPTPPSEEATHRAEWAGGVPTGWCECGKPWEYCKPLPTPPSEEATVTGPPFTCPHCGTRWYLRCPPSEEADAHHVHVGEHCLACVRHGVALAKEATVNEEATGSHLWQAIDAVAPDQHYARRVRAIVRAFFGET